VRAVGYVCFAACCMALASCGTFGKKSPFKPKEPPRQSANTGWPPPPDGAESPLSERAPPPRVGGLLAGRVLDSYDRPPPPTYIRVVFAGDAQDAKNSPLEVATDSQGYFTIQGLQAGQHYQLIARTRDGDPKLAGTTWATPPNPRILIFMSQDFATANTPAAPPPPAAPGQKPGAPAVPPPKRSQPSADASEGTPGKSAGEANRDPAKSSNSNGTAAGGATIGPPMKLNEPAQVPAAPRSAVPPPPRTEIRTQDIADTPEGGARVPPVTNIPAQPDLGRRPAPDPPSAAPPSPGPATQVPSCVLTGKQLHNFALYGLDARPWEYRYHQGRVVLLVFWETACLPCRAAIPHLKIFQNRYGPNGLEIIAIAYEEGSLQEQIRKLQTVYDRLEINYRLLLGGEVASCPVRNQFAVNAFPTLVLLDEHNRIIWRQQGLDAYKLQELEMLIRLQLRAR
jgi:thiol-disulfide isomerase/thioredoxin